MVGDSYEVTIDQTILGDDVFAFDNKKQENKLFNNTTTFTEFDVSDTTNTDYVLTFGTSVDNSGTVLESSRIIRSGTPGTAGASVLLNTRGYNNTVYYFEDSSANMGYVPPSLSTNIV